MSITAELRREPGYPAEISGVGLTMAMAQRKAADYAELTKPKIAVMALVTVAVGFMLGSAPQLQLENLLHTLIGAAVVAAGGSALNHWWERRADARMNRTLNRPIAAGRIHPLDGLSFGLTLGVAGIVYLLAALPGPMAAIVSAATFVLYVFVYTPLKQYTAWNTIVGAIPGALPPVIGWSAAHNSMAAMGWALFAILFVWQLPHFYSIAWLHRADYARGGMKMLPVVDHADGRWTGRATLMTSIVLIVVSAIPYTLGVTGWIYLAGALTVAVWFAMRCARFAKLRNDVNARSVLRGSLVYLLLVMMLFVVDGLAPRYL